MTKRRAGEESYSLAVGEEVISRGHRALGVIVRLWLVTRRWLHYIRRAESIARPWIIRIVAGPCAAVIPLFIPLAVIARAFCRALPGSPLQFGCIWPILFYFCPKHYIDRLCRKDVDLATNLTNMTSRVEGWSSFFMVRFTERVFLILSIFFYFTSIWNIKCNRYDNMNNMELFYYEQFG